MLVQAFRRLKTIMREKKHSKRIRPGNLVRVLSPSYVMDPNVIWYDRYGVRHNGREVHIPKGELGLVLEIGEEPGGMFGRPQKYCVILFEDRKLKFIGAYWYNLERVKRAGEE